MKHRIITISREFGSGGRTIGKLAAQRLGIPCYDQELIEKIAEKSGFSKDYIKNTEEASSRGGWFANALAGRSFAGSSNQDYLWAVQRKTILELAEQGPCVIVGRCADYVLRDMDHVTHIFLYASLEKRVERIMRLEHVDADEARELIRKTDKQRKSYYNFFADGNWGVRSNYDLMLRTDDHTPEEIAEMIIAYAHPGK